MENIKYSSKILDVKLWNPIMVFSKDNQHRHSLLTCKFKINAEDYFKTRLTKTDMQILVAHLISHNNQKGLSKLQSKHLELQKVPHDFYVRRRRSFSTPVYWVRRLLLDGINPLTRFLHLVWCIELSLHLLTYIYIMLS